jgi:equilibrative nucleoside transporter 1/2/3
MRGHPVAKMDSRTTLDRVRALFNKDNEQNYEPLSDASTLDEDVLRPVIFTADAENDETEPTKTDEGEPFSWFEYCIFLLLGIAMLWAWYVPSSSINHTESNAGTGICS